MEIRESTVKQDSNKSCILKQTVIGMIKEKGRFPCWVQLEDINKPEQGLGPESESRSGDTSMQSL